MLFMFYEKREHVSSNYTLAPEWEHEGLSILYSVKQTPRCGHFEQHFCCWNISFHLPSILEVDPFGLWCSQDLTVKTDQL